MLNTGLNTDLSLWRNNCKNPSMKSRIISEIGNMMYQCDNINLKIINDEYNISIKYKNKIFDIILSNDYPFKIPLSVIVNGRDYRQILSTNEPKINEYLKKYYYIGCLCCFSIMCPDNWMPTYNISHVINDMMKNIRIKRELLLYILCDNIKIKYRCYFLNIEEYLF